MKGSGNIITLFGILISAFFATITIAYDKKSRFTDTFNSIYRKIFAYRTGMNKIAEEHKFEDFYYEIDIILDITEIQEQTLDYLTEIENFFNLISLWDNSLDKLVSLAFYQRIAALYSYILYRKTQTNNQEIFRNYCKFTRKMSKMKKIKSQQKKYKRICYIGIRESDLYYSKYFKDSITLFPKKNTSSHFSVRLNQNIDHKEILPYLIEAVKKMQNKDYHFMFYNQYTAYNYPKEIIQKAICLNNQDLLSLLNNKLALKKWFVKHEIPIVPFETFIGNDILLSKCVTCFSGSNAFVIQCLHGGGGIGTYYVKKGDFSLIDNKILPLQQYIVSPYIKSISVNTHIFIAEKQTVLSPGSIQIVEEQEQQLFYCGCDFISFRKLPQQVRDEIKKLSLKIANFLRKDGYRGIAGIDFLVENCDKIYCTEINPRFQASSILIDRYLTEKKKESLEAACCFELNEMAFQGNLITTLHFDDKINYSMYYYYKNDSNINYYCEKLKMYQKFPDLEVYKDDVDWYIENGRIKNNSYLFRVIFKHSITQISPDGELWINDNIRVFPKPKSMLDLKVALLNQGVRLGDNISKVKEGTYESIDIKIKQQNSFIYGSDIAINCAYGIHLSKYSPYKIIEQNSHSLLYYYDSLLTAVSIEKNVLGNLDILSNKILYMATDRLRIKIISGCENKNHGRGCKFCNLPISDTEFSLEQIFDALKQFKSLNTSFRHILIGGGSSLSLDSWNKIMSICRYLKNDDFYKDKPISMMTMLPPIDLLADLKNSGISEVAFNMEIADEYLAQSLMPGKYASGKGIYYSTFKEAIKIFGTGNVRSTLLVGLDKLETLYNEIHTLADMGVLPCLSAFRALPGTEFSDEVGPTNDYLIHIYKDIYNILQNKHGEIKELGPKCPNCRNNMLHL